MEIKDKFFKRRNELGLTQIELAKKANVAKSIAIKSEVTPEHLRLHELVQIGQALNLTIIMNFESDVI